MLVSTQLKNISQIWSFLQEVVKIFPPSVCCWIPSWLPFENGSPLADHVLWSITMITWSLLTLLGPWWLSAYGFKFIHSDLVHWKMSSKNNSFLDYRSILKSYILFWNMIAGRVISGDSHCTKTSQSHVWTAGTWDGSKHCSANNSPPTLAKAMHHHPIP